MRVKKSDLMTVVKEILLQDEPLIHYKALGIQNDFSIIIRLTNTNQKSLRSKY
jgi:hypothetical protein